MGMGFLILAVLVGEGTPSSMNIEGSGNVSFGADTLTMAGSNLSKNFSDVIQDGGLCGGHSW